MIAYGNIATALEMKTSGNGKVYYVFRMAENQGKEENRTTTWYDVVAFISEIEADMLNKGMLVKMTGTLKGEAFMKRDGTPGMALRVTTGSVVPYEPRRRDQSEQSDDQG